MGWGEYARSKVPLKLVFITFAAIAVNLLIIGIFQLLVAYRFTSPIDEETLAMMDSRYENCTIVRTSRYDEPVLFTQREFTAYLLETEDGETVFTVVEKHLFLNRYRYVKKYSADIPKADGIQDITAGSVLNGVHARITDNSLISGFRVSHSGGSGALGFPLILVPMLIIEYLAFIFLFRRDELL